MIHPMFVLGIYRRLLILIVSNVLKIIGCTSGPKSAMSATSIFKFEYQMDNQIKMYAHSKLINNF